MDSYAAAPRPADQDRTEDPAPKRPIPTPADLFPRGVRRDTEENREGGEGGDEDGKDGELATGTG